MPKMFGFPRRRMRLGRLKVHLGDPTHGTRSPARAPLKRSSLSSGEDLGLASVSCRVDEAACRCSSGTFDINGSVLESSENWTILSTEGDRPSPRFNHAAAIVGNKMVMVGGDSGHRLLDDTRILNMVDITWAYAAPKISSSQSERSWKIRPCKGHCLVPWGNSVILVGGKTDPAYDHLSVWCFDTVRESWSHVEAKGDIPTARSGHTVIRAGLVLILFGGEDVKGKKLNDLHMFDLKSLTWLPLHYKGTGPSPRSNHVAALYQDRVLLIFGGESKSKTLNDLFSLDFDTMIWTRVKTHGLHPSPRSGCCGALCGTKWYIAGGGSKARRHGETLVFDVVESKWSVYVVPPSTSITTKKGFSMVTLQHRDKIVLVAFGGSRKEPANQVEVLVIIQNDHASSWRSAPDADQLLYDESPLSSTELNDHLSNNNPLYSLSSVTRDSENSASEQRGSGRRSLSESVLRHHPNLGSVSLRRQFQNGGEGCSLAQKLQKPIDDEKCKDTDDYSTLSTSGRVYSNGRQEIDIQVDIDRMSSLDTDASSEQQKRRTISPEKDPETDARATVGSTSFNMCQLYESKIAHLTSRVAVLEEQLATVRASKELVEKNLSFTAAVREETEKRLAEREKELELMNEKLASLEFAQEESNSLSNAVHYDNVRLEHDVAFLKAILEDTQKELHSTRGVLAAERARAFQLQVEVFHLKQRLQGGDNRSPTPRKQI